MDTDSVLTTFTQDLLHSIPKIDDHNFTSFTRELSHSIPDIEEEESYRWRFSKKRKYNKVTCVIDDHTIIREYDFSDSEYNDDDLVRYCASEEFRVWRRAYIKKYKCKK